jgi:NAD(P)-dependent dehydrogenase (short-subunit alcohol dehydrogenase family)
MCALGLSRIKKIMLADRVYIVTGGATGIGAGIVRVLESYGARTAIFQPENCDVRDPEAVERGVAEVEARFGRIDGIVNNAALTGLPAASAFLSVTPAHVDEVLAVNVKGPVYCSQAVARRAIAAKRPASIVHITSVGAFAAQEHASIYCASKAALTALTQSMALELAPHGIRVNAVAPGDIETPASARIVADLRGQGSSGRYIRQTPLGRRGTPEEIGEAVAFLLSDKASFTTGATLLVDGGFLSY